MIRLTLAAAAAATLLATPLAAQAPAGKPGAVARARVVPGTYKVDPNHTQVVWTVDHMGFSPLTGAFGAKEGSLTIDPRRPAAARVSVIFDVAGLSTTVPAFTKHLLSGDFFEAAKHPTATFVSTRVVPTGPLAARITGNLTIKGVTRPVVLNARFFGAGTNPMSKQLNVGFSATGTIQRSQFGLNFALPVVPDQVDLKIAGAFVKAD